MSYPFMRKKISVQDVVIMSYPFMRRKKSDQDVLIKIGQKSPKHQICHVKSRSPKIKNCHFKNSKNRKMSKIAKNQQKNFQNSFQVTYCDQKFPENSKTYHSKSLIVNKNFQDIYIFLKFLSKTLLSCPTLISEIEEYVSYQWYLQQFQEL